MKNNTIYEGPIISVYQNQLDEIKAANIQQYYVYGPRGIGKTYFLKMLENELGPSSIFIEGNNFKKINETFLSNIYESKVKLEGKQLFFDDFDLFLTRIYNNLTTLESEKIFATAFSICNYLVDSHKLMIFAGRLTPEMLSEISIKYNDENARALVSLVISRLVGSSTHLDPFKGNYYDYTNAIGDEINHKLLKHNHDIPDNVRNMWKEMIINRTGGHPALLDPVLKAYKKSVENIENLKNFERKIFRNTNEDPSNELEQGIINFIEDTLHRGPINIIQRTLQDFRSNTTPEYREAIKYLFQLASKDELPPPNNPYVRNLLKEAAIVAQNEGNGYFLIPGEIIKREIIRMYSSRIDDLQLQITPLSSDSGIVEYFLDGIEKKIKFNGKTWEILSILKSKPNTIFSLSELETNSHFITQSGLKSAIQRLENKMNSLIPNKKFIENVRGEGYRINI